MICFYHSADGDGKCSGHWVNALASRDPVDPRKKFVGINYGKDFPLEIIKKDESVYIVDYSIEPDEMKRLLRVTPNVTWIDHHKTAIEKYKDFDKDIRGVRYDGVAACMLTYCYLTHMTNHGTGNITPFNLEMSESAPMYTKLLADWDVFKFDYGDDTRWFQAAFNCYNLTPISSIWSRLSNQNLVNTMIEQGKIMLKFRDSWAASYMSLGFETIFEGHKCFAVNLGRCNSEYFNSITDPSIEIFMPFVFDGNQYSISMYSKSVDVSNIAKKYGGGGHAGASGFRCDELPFKKE